MVNKSIVEIKWNHKKNLNSKKAENEETRN